MTLSVRNAHNFPLNYPMNFSGKCTSKIVIKKDSPRKDGTCPLYLQVFLNKERKRFPLNISVPVKDFDESKQRIKSNHYFSTDFNLIIEKALGDINKIEINYRLSNLSLSLDKLIEEYENPTSRLDFCKFWEMELVVQKEKLKPGTYRQQETILNKLRAFKQQVFFYEIDEQFIDRLKSHLKNKLKNNENTIASFIKSFKKYLRIANKRGIITPVMNDEIKRKSFKSNPTFLFVDELQKLNSYFNSDFINATHKIMLARFLFSCFTGLRISDNLKLGPDNFANDILFFTSEKSEKMQKIKLNKAALSYIDPEHIFYGSFTNEYINRELKVIAKICGIRKRITFHVSRHTFATNYLLCGGNVVNLQKTLGHSKIEETMIYVGIVESMTNMEMMSMDEILKK